MSFKTCLLIVGLTVCLLDQALSLQCYTCTTELDLECSTKPKQPKFQVTCPNNLNFAQDNEEMLIESYISSVPLAEGLSSERLAFDCGTIVAGRPGDKYHTVRACLIAQIPCETYKAYLEQQGFRVKSCSKCAVNLCNSLNN